MFQSKIGEFRKWRYRGGSYRSKVFHRQLYKCYNEFCKLDNIFQHGVQEEKHLSMTDILILLRFLILFFCIICFMFFLELTDPVELGFISDSQVAQDRTSCLFLLHKRLSIFKTLFCSFNLVDPLECW